MSMSGIPVASEIEAHRQGAIHVANQPTATTIAGYFRQFWQKQGAVVQGTWGWAAVPSQTDFASITSEAAGIFYNTSLLINDEYKWPNIFLPAGTYKVTLVGFTAPDRGITELLFGTTSIGTVDGYSAVAAYNIVTTFTLVISTPTTADFRIKNSGKNAAATNYTAQFSRLHIEKTA